MGKVSQMKAMKSNTARVNFKDACLCNRRNFHAEHVAYLLHQIIFKFTSKNLYFCYVLIKSCYVNII